MAQAYWQSGVTRDATFSLHFRNFPSNRSYYVFVGLEDVLDYLEDFRFTDDDIEALRNLSVFDDGFLKRLSELNFSGEVRAMPEGTLFFENEPVLEVSGPVIECQLAETFLVNQINLQSMMATKAARVVHAAGGRQVMDFAARRTHGTDAAVKLARAAHIAGFAGTSNVQAAAMYGIPPAGTMAHSFVTTFEREADSFSAYAASFPDSSIFLVDTYDTKEGVKNAIECAQNMRELGHSLRGIRLDSGDLLTLSQMSRRMLDEAGLNSVQIFASGGLDEFSIESLVNSGAPIDGFGVGTKVGASEDAPYTDFVYKMVKYARRPIMKLSDDKATTPGPKQVFRESDQNRTFRGDIIGCEPDADPGDQTELLLRVVMERGKRLQPKTELEHVRAHFENQFARLPAELKALRPQDTYPVALSDKLNKLTRQTMQSLTAVEEPI
jgi:nicotinate phosphoribosyltransferase